MVGVINNSYSVYENKYNLYNQNKDAYSSMPQMPQDDRRLISDAKDANNNSALNNNDKKKECQTCKNRKYKDGSNDPGVSYKTPTKINSGSAATAVRRHEYEHVNREQAKARREGKEILFQSVTIHTAICPECGKAYISGGTTKTATKT